MTAKTHYKLWSQDIAFRERYTENAVSWTFFDTDLNTRNRTLFRQLEASRRTAPVKTPASHAITAVSVSFELAWLASGSLLVNRTIALHACA